MSRQEGNSISFHYGVSGRQLVTTEVVAQANGAQAEVTNTYDHNHNLIRTEEYPIDAHGNRVTTLYYYNPQAHGLIELPKLTSAGVAAGATEAARAAYSYSYNQFNQRLFSAPTVAQARPIQSDTVISMELVD